MSDEVRIDRREFTLQAALLALAGVTITVTGCGGGGGGGNPNAPSGGGGGAAGATTDRVGVVGLNHGHSAVVTNAQLVAGNGVELDITGTADHGHRLTLSTDQVRQIAAGREVSKTCTDAQAHTHLVTFRSGSPTPGAPDYE